MLSLCSRRFRPAWMLLVLSTRAVADDGYDQSFKFTTLDTKKGQTPCDIARGLLFPCWTPGPGSSGSLAQRDTMPTPITGPCSCNTVFFNVWSACELSTNGPEPPPFDVWAQNCKQNLTAVTLDGYPLEGQSQVDIPSWAYVKLSDNKFDVDAAIAKARGWELIQVVTPIIVAAVLIFGFSTLFYFYRKRVKARGREGPNPKAMWDRTLKLLNVFPKRRARQIQRPVSFDYIERGTEADGWAEYTSMYNPAIRGQVQPQPNPQLQPQSNPQLQHPGRQNSAETSLTVSTWGRLYSFKPRASKVVSTPAPPSFRIDASRNNSLLQSQQDLRSPAGRSGRTQWSNLIGSRRSTADLDEEEGERLIYEGNEEMYEGGHHAGSDSSHATPYDNYSMQAAASSTTLYQPQPTPANKLRSQYLLANQANSATSGSQSQLNIHLNGSAVDLNPERPSSSLRNRASPSIGPPPSIGATLVDSPPPGQPSLPPFSQPPPPFESNSQSPLSPYSFRPGDDAAYMASSELSPDLDPDEGGSLR